MQCAQRKQLSLFFFLWIFNAFSQLPVPTLHRDLRLDLGSFIRAYNNTHFLIFIFETSLIFSLSLCLMRPYSFVPSVWLYVSRSMICAANRSQQLIIYWRFFFFFFIRLLSGFRQIDVHLLCVCLCLSLLCVLFVLNGAFHCHYANKQKLKRSNEIFKEKTKKKKISLGICVQLRSRLWLQTIKAIS